jgi:hypothetical protein
MSAFFSNAPNAQFSRNPQEIPGDKVDEMREWNEPLGAEGAPLVGEEVRNKDAGKVGTPTYLMSQINRLEL